MGTVTQTLRLNDQISNTLNKIQQNSLKTIQTFNKFDSEVKAAQKTLEDFEKANPSLIGTKAHEQAVNALEDMNYNLEKVKNGEIELKDENEKYNNSLERTVAKWVSIGALVKGAKKLIDLSDTYTQTSARLGLITDDVEGLQNKIFAVAKDSRVAYQSVADTVASLGMQAGDAFNNSTDEILGFSNLLNKVFTTSGLDASGIQSVMYNLTQSLSSGALLGQDYRILKQNAPEIVKILQNYYKVTASELNDMVSQGKVTAQDLKLAMFGAADEINEKFEKMPMTWGQVWTNIANIAYKASIPLLKIVNWFANNLDIIAPIVLSIAGAIAIYTIATKGAAIATMAWAKAQAVLDGFMAMSPLGAIIILVTVFIGLLYGIVAVINKITGTSISATGLIVGTIYKAGAIIGNIGIGLYNLFAKLVNGINDLFTHLVAGIVSLFLDLSANVLSILSKLAKAIDFIFGSNLSSTLSGWADSLTNLEKDIWNSAKGDNSIMYEVGYIDTQKAGMKGYEKGANLFNNDENNDLLNGINDKLNSVVGNGANGGKALKTTTDDKLLSEDDIQLLLDVATRDYQLSYQQVTPNITMTFGDIRETADVDGVLEVVGNRLEELINSDMEVMN